MIIVLWIVKWEFLFVENIYQVVILKFQHWLVSKGEYVKPQMAGSYPQSFWFSRSRESSENLHFNRFLGDVNVGATCLRNHTLKSSGNGGEMVQGGKNSIYRYTWKYILKEIDKANVISCQQLWKLGKKFMEALCNNLIILLWV